MDRIEEALRGCDLFASIGTSGAVYPKQGYIARRQPVLRFTTLKADLNATVSHFLRAASGTVAVYYWKGVDAGDRTAVASGAHLKISAATSAFSDDSLTVSENDDGNAVITVLPKGSLAYDIASAIP